MSQEYTVAVVGATGAVGREMVRILEERRFPIQELRLLASPRSAGKSIDFRGKAVTVHRLQAESLEGCHLALFSAGGKVSLEMAPQAWERGCVVIDNSSAWRMDPQVPLVVPEVNPEEIPKFSQKGIIGNPNCSTIQMVLALKPLHDAARLRRVVVSTYQSASGAGQKGIRELSQQAVACLNMKPLETSTFPHQLAFNVLPHIDRFLENGSTFEEQKMVQETHKILDPAIGVSATCVRVPVFCGHSESINIETEEKLSANEARERLADFPGIVVLDRPSENEYPLPSLCVGEDMTLVGRIREDPSRPNALNLWVVSDNLRKGAALNAVQIAEHLTPYLDPQHLA